MELSDELFERETKTYTIGLDYGSLSGRGVIVDTDNGNIVAEAVMEYPHRIIDHKLHDGTPLEGHWFLQNPQDYLSVLKYIVPELLKKSEISPKQIVGIGVDFTTSTVIPIDKNFRPLSMDPKYASRPHAWTKLWKHRSATSQAAKMTHVCKEQDLNYYLQWNGGQLSAGCLIAKVLQVFEEDRKVYDAADSFIEAGDYLTSLLTGTPVFSSAIACAKALWFDVSLADKSGTFLSRLTDYGYPDNTFFCALNQDLCSLPANKLIPHFKNAKMGYPGEKIGILCDEMAKTLGLCPGIAVTPPHMDAYAAMPGVGIADSGKMMIIMGTSSGIMVLSKEKKSVPGTAAFMYHGHYPNYWSYVSSQPSVGDCFQWFVDNCVPENYVKRAQAEAKDIHQYLTDLAGTLSPGETGLIALDWFNGGSSLTGSSALSGMLVGLTLKTKPEHIYRALLEATAFGARRIMENYVQSGIAIEEVVACGGIPGKNPLMMQIYADVLAKPLKVSFCKQAPALGSAIYAAAAAKEQTGFHTVFEAVCAMGSKEYITYNPIPENCEIYDKIYQEYCNLQDEFGDGSNSLMKRLSSIKNNF